MSSSVSSGIDNNDDESNVMKQMIMIPGKKITKNLFYIAIRGFQILSQFIETKLS